ncbi:hypothetical protein PF004_g27673 [Phytophthora fragariae]|uniref:Uncharacterized protein n=1 Tax=Phytophthora fragariae TaxID=53985 RepID=A0A6G0MJU5_9STRA|nr:hypothetical protein PF004_g27673 [Phytophthora fragariae]
MPHWPAIGCVSVIFCSTTKTVLPFPKTGTPSSPRLRATTRCPSLERSLAWILQTIKMVKVNRKTIRIHHPVPPPKDVLRVVGRPAPSRLPLTPNGIPNEAPTRYQRPHNFVSWSGLNIRLVACPRGHLQCGQWRKLAGLYRGLLCGTTFVWTFSD